MKIVNAVFVLLFIVAGFTATAQLKVGDQPTATRKAVSIDAQGSNGLQGLWLPRVSDTSVTGIRSLNPPDGVVIYHPPSGKLFLRSNGAWVTFVATSAITRITTGSVFNYGPNVNFTTGTSAGTTNDFNITASPANTIVFNQPSASPTVRGVVTTDAQSIGGAKTFTGGVTVSGATGPVSNLTLGITDTTTAAPVNDKYLSVDSVGKVTVNQVPVITNRQIRIKSYSVDMDNLPTNLNNHSVDRYTFTIPGANFSLNSTVIVTPLYPLRLGTAIDFSRVYDANTIEMNMSTGAVAQPFTKGNTGTFNITVIEF